MGAIPLDCQNLSFCSLYKLDFEKLYKNGKIKLGIIFNHDKYGSPGSHWVAMYIDLENGNMDFCDSIGNGPIDNIQSLISQFKLWYNKKTGKNFTFSKNIKKYQLDQSECGVYSSNFIIRRLSGESFNDIIKRSLTFKEINSCRNVYFSNVPSNHKSHALCDPN